MSPLLSVLVSGLALGTPAQGKEAPWAVGMDGLHRLDLLPAFKRSVKIGAVTSYDRTGGNDDGFSGKYSFVRKEGEDLVLADLQGPGVIYRIHTPTPTDDPIEFYFDGETTPRLRLKFRDMFTGNVAPFERPLVDYAGGGYYSYIPLPYKKACKVVLRGKHLQFYDLNYATYPADAPIQTFDPKTVDRAGMDRAIAIFRGGRQSDLTKFNVPPGTKLRKQSIAASLAPGKSVTLFESKRPGRIASLRLGPSDAFAGKLRDVLLRITWDGDSKPAVLCPAGDFFGYAWGRPATGSALVGTHEGMNYCNLPMPFDRAAKVELVSLRTGGGPIAVQGEVVVGDTGRRPYEGKFYAAWRRENPTTQGKPFTWLETAGRGHIVGLALQSQGKEPGNTFFFEGDDNTTIDGELVVHGTGSEDFFNGGWYDVPGRWDAPVARALSGAMAYQKPLGRTGAYRFFLGDAYPYRKWILQTIEHGPERNAHPSDYAGVAYFYSENRPTIEFPVPTLAERAVVDPTDLTFVAHWTVPIHSFAFREATLSRREVPADGKRVRALSMRAVGPDDFGPPFIALGVDLPAGGRYRVSIDAVKGPEQGTVQLFQDESPVGKAVDLYNLTPTVANRLVLGEIDAVEGQNSLMFKLVGKHADAKGLGFDLIHIICEKIP
ncbi:MAG: glycoside hydrolase family 172 protein [Fimbriimonas sp.]